MYHCKLKLPEFLYTKEEPLNNGSYLVKKSGSFNLEWYISYQSILKKLEKFNICYLFNLEINKQRKWTFL